MPGTIGTKSLSSKSAPFESELYQNKNIILLIKLYFAKSVHILVFHIIHQRVILLLREYWRYRGGKEYWWES